MDEDNPDTDQDDEPPVIKRGKYDRWIEPAKRAVIRRFSGNPRDLAYSRQICIGVEGDYFHWVTRRALGELVADGKLEQEPLLRVNDKTSIQLYHRKSHRDIRTQTKEIVSLVSQFSDNQFMEGLGRQGEMMFDAALGRAAFQWVSDGARSFNGIHWTETKHDLDRILITDGVPFGVEYKNTLPYMPPDEFALKLRMCRVLGLRPLFVARRHPKNYMHEMNALRGFGLIYDEQYYPHGNAHLATEVKTRLGLPVACPKLVPQGHIDRLLQWIHLEKTRGTYRPRTPDPTAQQT